MLKTYQKYIIQNFLSKFFLITLIFFALTIILGSLEEITFLKNLDKHFLYPYFLTFLNAPITLFEILPAAGIKINTIIINNFKYFI